MTCPRCRGLMVHDVYTATQWADIDDQYFYRCVACGNCEDALILQHRLHRPEVRTQGRHDYIAKGKERY